MTVSTEVTRVIVEGNAVATSFAYSFPIPGANATDQTNAELLLLGTDSSITVLADNLWSMTGVGTDVGGTFTFNPGSPLTTGAFLVLNRIVPYLQTTELTAQGAYSPAVVMAALDNLAFQTEQLNTRALQAVRAPITDAALSDLPTADLRANSFLYFDDNGDVTTASSTGGMPSSILVGTNSTSAVGTTELLLTGSGLAVTSTNGITTATFSGGGGLAWFNVVTYGAAGNGTTDDTTAINLAIAALNTATKGVLYFPAGIYKCTAALTTITAAGKAMGDGGANSEGTLKAATIINQTSQTANLFTITSQAFEFCDMALANTFAGTPSAGAAISCTGTANQRVNYDNIFVHGFYINVDVQVGEFWSMRNCVISGPVLYGVKIQNTAIADQGDWNISDTSITSDAYAATAGIYMSSSGGGKIVNTKIVHNSTTYFVNGIEVVGGGGSSVLLVGNSSIEGYTTAGINISGSWPRIVMDGLQIHQLNGTANAITVANTTDVVIDNLSLSADTGTPTAIVISSVTRCSIGPNITNNGFTTLISGTVDQDATGSIGSLVRVTGTPTAGQVPTASSGTAATWATPSGGSGGGGSSGGFGRSVLLGLANSTQAINNGSETIVSWDAAVWDTGGFFSGGAPTQVTIPAGVTKIKVTAETQSTGGTVTKIDIYIYKNGVQTTTGLPEFNAPLTGGGGTNTITSAVIAGALSVAPGDTIKLACAYTGSSLKFAQYQTYLFVEDISDGSATVSTTDATVTTLATIALSDNITTLVDAIVVAVRTGGSSGSTNDGAGYKITATYKSTSGTAALIGSVAQTVVQESQAGWDATMDANSSNARIRVTGATNNNVDWFAFWKIYTVA